MSPLSVVLIVAVAGLVIWRLIRSYGPGADTRGGDVVDGYSPLYGAGGDGGYDPGSPERHSQEAGSHGAAGDWERPGDGPAESGADSGGGDNGASDSGGSDGGGDSSGDGGGGDD